MCNYTLITPFSNLKTWFMLCLLKTTTRYILQSCNFGPFRFGSCSRIFQFFWQWCSGSGARQLSAKLSSAKSTSCIPNVNPVHPKQLPSSRISHTHQIPLHIFAAILSRGPSKQLSQRLIERFQLKAASRGTSKNVFWKFPHPSNEFGRILKKYTYFCCKIDFHIFRVLHNHRAHKMLNQVW